MSLPRDRLLKTITPHHPVLICGPEEIGTATWDRLARDAGGTWRVWLCGASRPFLEAESMYDVVIVGARVAGAPLAFLLARRGYQVLLLDKAKFPSDISSSTLLI